MIFKSPLIDWCREKFRKSSKSWVHNQKSENNPAFTGQPYPLDGSQVQE